MVRLVLDAPGSPSSPVTFACRSLPDVGPFSRAVYTLREGASNLKYKDAIPSLFTYNTKKFISNSNNMIACIQTIFLVQRLERGRTEETLNFMLLACLRYRMQFYGVVVATG